MTEVIKQWLNVKHPELRLGLATGMLDVADIAELILEYIEKEYRNDLVN